MIKKYVRNSVKDDTLRTVRDRRVQEILTGGLSNDYERYQDIPESSSASSSSYSQPQPVNLFKLKSNLIFVSETLKTKLRNVFNVRSLNDPTNSTSSLILPSQPTSPQTQNDPVLHQSKVGRVFGRPVTNENFRPFHNAAYNSIVELRDESGYEDFQSTPSNPFFNKTPQQNNSNISPLARIDVNNQIRPSHDRDTFENIFNP